jgi:hydrogenase expression/formation protein HypE
MHAVDSSRAGNSRLEVRAPVTEEISRDRAMAVDSSVFSSCPAPYADGDAITLAHGGGGRLTNNLISEVFRAAFSSRGLDAQHDGAVCSIPAGRVAMTTDSYVVHPRVFPGGTIGTLAVNGTVNDLAMCGARPMYLSAGFVIEEGFRVSELRQIVGSMRDAARVAGVEIVTGDTKVVDRGKADGLFINTSGVGSIAGALKVGPSSVKPGDALIVSGDIGRHGIAIMAVREGLEFETTIESDCAPVHDVVMDLLEEGVEFHCLRDLTRGGLATALVEISSVAGRALSLDEAAIPVDVQVAAACEILGLDPLYVACEGRFVCFCPDAQARKAVEVMRRHAVSAEATCAGWVGDSATPRVVLNRQIGSTRVLDLLSGEQLPRIC